MLNQSINYHKNLLSSGFGLAYLSPDAITEFFDLMNKEM